MKFLLLIVCSLIKYLWATESQNSVLNDHQHLTYLTEQFLGLKQELMEVKVQLGSMTEENKELKAGISFLADVNVALTKRVEVLEDDNRALTEKVNSQTIKTQSVLKARVHSLADQQQTIKTYVDSLAIESRRTKYTLRELLLLMEKWEGSKMEDETEYADIMESQHKEEIETQTTVNQSDSLPKIKETVVRQKKLLLPPATTTPQTTNKVAFSARLTQNIQLGKNQIIEYNQVITNIGNAFDSRHGHFTAPVDGVYFLSFTITNREGNEVYIEMVKNGAQVAIAYADGDDYSMGSQSILLQLIKGDMVWVRHNEVGTPTIIGSPSYPYNSFSGGILFEM